MYYHQHFASTNPRELIERHWRAEIVSMCRYTLLSKRWPPSRDKHFCYRHGKWDVYEKGVQSFLLQQIYVHKNVVDDELVLELEF